MVWSRCDRRLPLQPSISCSTSRSVRYSRVLISPFFGRRGVTFRILALGGTTRKVGFVMVCRAFVADDPHPLMPRPPPLFVINVGQKYLGPEIPRAPTRTLSKSPLALQLTQHPPRRRPLCAISLARGLMRVRTTTDV